MKRLWGRLEIVRSSPGIKITILLFAVLLAINSAAVWTILSARRNVNTVAAQDLRLHTTAQARSVEALLATHRGDFLFLSQSSPLATAPAVLANSDPLRRRWGRLNIEGTVILFLQTHPAVSQIVLRSPDGTPIVVAVRRQGVPVLLPPGDFREPARSEPGIWASRWAILDEQGVENGYLETLLQTARLLDVAAPGPKEGLSLIENDTAPASESGGEGDTLVASEQIRDDNWPTPIRWRLIRTQAQSQLISSVATLAGHYRNTVILNLMVITLTLVLGAVAFRQIHRSALLEAENQHQARVRELERQVMHSERLASVGRLAAGLAHEINNPLEGMSNYLSLLEDDLRHGRSEGCLELALGIHEGLNRAAGITRQVLSLSDPGRSPKVPLDLCEVARETFEFVRSNPAFRPVRLSLQLPDSPVRISGNRITLGQVVLNLLLNACEHQEASGGEVDLRLNANQSEAELIVADRGPGIPEDALPRIFEPFFSTRGSTGLGLALCHSIVSAHGGQVAAENRPEGGALFRVNLPLLKEDTQQSGEDAVYEGAS